MTPSERASVFAEKWYARSEEARDCETLSFMLARVLHEVADAATLIERDRIAAKLAKLTGP